MSEKEASYWKRAMNTLEGLENDAEKLKVYYSSDYRSNIRDAINEAREQLREIAWDEYRMKHGVDV